MTDRLRQVGSSAVGPVSDAARQIWLAGLGAFVRTGTEGSKLFNALVEEGEQFQGRSKEAAGATMNQVVDQATGRWDKLEKVFEDRVARALARLGVPSKEEVEALNARIEKLQSTVESLQAPKPAAKRSSTARKRTQTGADKTA